MSATNWEGLGQTYGPLYCLKVNYTHSNTQALNKPIIEKTEWKSAGVNTGFIKVSVKIENHQNGTSYIPCYNTYNPAEDSFDDNWYFFPKENEDSFSFEVHNPISEGTYSYIKILAINSDGIITSSELQNLNVAGIDNNPPQAAWGLTYHDSQLSFDGHSFSYNNLIRDDENSVINNFYYYYTVYDEAWGDSLDIFTPEQIQNLPHANGTYSYFQDNPTGENNDGNGWSPLIPINGLADGKYMFFIKALDASGNYFITSLGKAYIGTFKNKLRVEYDEDTNKFTSTLKINDNEYFDRNMINVQYFNQGDKIWMHFYEMQNELQNCILNKNTKELENTTNPNIIKKERIKAWEWVKNPDTGEYEYVPDVCTTSDVEKPLAKGTFYRLTIQSFNQNEYNPETGKGVNHKYALPYSEDFSAHNIVYEVDGETEYDLCTEETVSNTVYYYIPASKTELNEFKKSFFKNTAGLKTNRPALVHVISSLTNLGSDIDEWERRGKLVATHYYDGLQENTGFNDSVAADDMYKSGEKGTRYYVIIVHYANNQTDISNVYEVSNSN